MTPLESLCDKQQLPKRHRYRRWSRHNIEEISVTALKMALKYMKNGKATGPGSISIELMKYERDILQEKLVEVYYKCFLRCDDIRNDCRMGYHCSMQTKGNKKYLYQ